MSLRARLTLLFTLAVGSILLLFGVLVYQLVGLFLLDQIDSDLTKTAYAYREALRVNTRNQFDPRSLVNVQTGGGQVVQIWGADRSLQFSRPPGRKAPLDEFGRRAGEPVFRQVEGSPPLRVLSLPLLTNRGPAGVLQVGADLSLMITMQRALLLILTVISFLVVGVVALVMWFFVGRELAPLATITEVALQVARADDLSRRIPLRQPPEDEIGRLILAFNQTLERLEHLFTAQRRFLTDVSHELRTPLTVIKGNVGLIRRIGADEESLAGIEGEVDRLTRLVGNLLLLAQAESGKLPLEISPVELDTVLLDVYQQAKLLAGERIQVRLAEIDQVLVPGDQDRLKQVLINLVGNAVQYTPPNGQVTLSLRKSSEQAQLIISDTGAGIPAQDLPHIFERFYRGERSRKRSPGSGFGLGLSIAYWLVRNHGGTIEVSSKEGKGTTFCVYLPLAKAEVEDEKQ